VPLITVELGERAEDMGRIREDAALEQDARTLAARVRPHPGAPGRGRVGEIQRRRMLAAAVDVVEEVGYERLTVARIIARARVSRKTF
jgi:AcrR family transcriptional regulator